MIHAISVAKIVTIQMNVPTNVQLAKEQASSRNVGVSVTIVVKLATKKLTVGKSKITKTKGLLGIRPQAIK